MYVCAGGCEARARDGRTEPLGRPGGHVVVVLDGRAILQRERHFDTLVQSTLTAPSVRFCGTFVREMVIVDR